MIKLIPIVLYMTLLVQKVRCDVQCGVTKLKANQLILQGNETKNGQWPWHVAVYHRKYQTSKYACGGTLISEWFVLTAAHCVLNEETRYDLSKAAVFIRLGVYILDNFNNIQQHDLEEIYKWPDYDRNKLIDDIALLKLFTKAEYNQYVQPACLNQMDDLTGQNGTAIGWGLTEANVQASKLKKAVMPVISFLTCLSSDPDFFGNILGQTNGSVLCAGHTNGTAVCNGDSGGGLFFQRGEVWYLGGIVSVAMVRDDGSSLCHTKSYGVFTKVSHYLPWIIKTANIEASQLNGHPMEEHKPAGNWIVILQRIDGSERFNRTWDEYRKGFGTIGREFWIGLEQMHQLTKDSPYELKIEMEDFMGISRYASYDRFAIGSAEFRHPIVLLGTHSGTAGDALSPHYGYGFSTIDGDPFGCSLQWGSGGWWFYPGNCYSSSLTGIWLEQKSWQAVIWDEFETGDDYTQLKHVKMMIRRVDVK